MNSIQLIAAAAIAAHNALIHSAVSLGTTPQAAWDAQSQEKRDTAIAGATLIWRAPETTAEQSHTAWVARQTAAGWTVGETYDEPTKKNPLLVAWPDLPAADKQQEASVNGFIRSYYTSIGDFQGK